MRKNISNLLQKGNLTPKERILLFAYDSVSKDKDGKAILSDADKEALTGGWQAKDNTEIAEYNKWANLWQTVGFAELDAQTTFLDAQNKLLRAGRLIDYAFGSVMVKGGGALDHFRRSILGDKDKSKEALNTMIDVCGLEYDQLIYMRAMELASKELKDDLLILYPDAETERDYLEQEQEIAELCQAGKQEKIADKIARRLDNRYKRAYTFEKDDLVLVGYYASIPLIEVAKKWAEYNDIDYKEQVKKFKDIVKKDAEDKEYIIELIALTRALKDYADENKTTIKQLIKETVIKWLDEGFFDDYPPLYLAEDKATCNDKETSRPHKEIYADWIKVKEQAIKEIDELISKGKLKTKTKTYKILGDKITKKMITGDSLYNLKGDYTFATDFKLQLDDYKYIGGLINLLQKAIWRKEYAILLSFLELFEALSKVFKIDLTYKIKDWLLQLDDDIEILNRELGYIQDEIIGQSYDHNGIIYLAETFTDDLFIDPDKIEPIRDKVDIYYREFTNKLDKEFTKHL
jgi:hypothetical protein